MTTLRAALLATALFGVGGAAAQTPASDDSLPPGLVRQGNVVMMAPIGDTKDVNAGPTLTGERRVGLVHFLAPADHELYTNAFAAADRGDWIAARGLAGQGHDSTAQLLVEWRYLLDRNSGASFGEISQFLKNYPDWPDRDTLFARAEKAMDASMDAHAVLAWFGDRAPVSDIGKIRLGEALIATGSASRGRDLVREGWIDGSFDPDQEFAILQKDGNILTPDVDRQRLERLIWRNDISDAHREMARVPSDAQSVAEARFALRSNPESGERMVARLPQDSRDDPGIIFDRTRLLRQQMDVDEIPKLLVKAPTREMAKISPDRWWDELNLDIREAIQSGSYGSAYDIAAHTGLTSDTGTDYSEAEFLAGWIALRYLKDTQTALTHFQNLATAVSRPISLARAHYWEGRTYEAAGDLASAWAQYKAAAAAPEAFYGQLAQAKIEAEPLLHLRDETIDASALRTDYDRESLTHAVHVLADLGEESMLRDFAVHDAIINTDPRHVKLLAEDLFRMGFKEVALRVAKEASYNNIALLSYSHPTIALPAYTGPGSAPESALVLGIIRQETEFDPDAVSSAGARGIIQIMPASARHMASLAGLPYRPNDLTGDPTYDIQLGMTELAGDLSDWGGSYVLAVAAYNAGSANVRKWIATYGDPRDSRTDPIDWIEKIPFSETRNYVQRVLENMEVYRNRLAGRDMRLQILADLYRPNVAQVQLLQYTPPVAGTASDIPMPIPKPQGPASGGSSPSSAAGPQVSSSGEAPAVAPTPRPDP